MIRRIFGALHSMMRRTGRAIADAIGRIRRLPRPETLIGVLLVGVSSGLLVWLLTDDDPEPPGPSGPPKLAVEQKVRGGTCVDDWCDGARARAGDTLELAIGIHNVGGTEATDVIVRFELPAQVRYLAGSCFYKTAGNPEKRPCGGDQIPDGGLSFTDAQPNGWAFVYASVRVVGRGTFSSRGWVNSNQTPDRYDGLWITAG